MATITLRSVKGSALTFAEGDANFTNLNDDKIENITNEPIGDLSDVSITTPSQGQVLTYTLSGNWENQDASSGATQLSELSDVDASLAATGGQVLVWNDINMYFEAQTLTIPSDTSELTNGAGFITSADVVDDTTPQLGGDLDGQGNKVEDVELDNYKETIYSLGSTDTPTIDVANGNVQTVSISAGLTLPAFSNAETGQSVTLLVTGSGTVSGGITHKFAGGNTTLTTSSVISIFYDGSNYWTSVATDFQ